MIAEPKVYPIIHGSPSNESIQRYHQMKYLLRDRMPRDEFWQKNILNPPGVYMLVVYKHHDFRQEMQNFDIENAIYIPIGAAMEMFCNDISILLSESCGKIDQQKAYLLLVVTKDNDNWFLVDCEKQN